MVGLDNPLHIALVLIVVLMVFGAKRLPEMGKGLGEGMRGFKQAISGETTPEPTPAPAPATISLSKAEEPVAPVVPVAPVAPVAVSETPAAGPTAPVA